MLCILTLEVAQGDTHLGRAQKRRVIYLAQKLRMQGTDEIGDREGLLRKKGGRTHGGRKRRILVKPLLMRR